MSSTKMKWDTLVKGLHTKTLASGAKVYMFYYRMKDGTQRRPKLGDCNQMSLADARALARELRLKVLNNVDPKAEWDQSKQELTIDEMFEHVWAGYWNKPRFIESRWAKEVTYNYKNHVKPTFGHMRMSQVSMPAVRSWHRAFAETSINAGNRSLDVLSRLYSYAEEEGRRIQGTSPCSLVVGHVEKKRDRVASLTEILAVKRILEREKGAYPRQVAFIYTLMFTGARPRSIERAKKNEIQFFDDHAVLTFAGKGTAATGQKETVVIPTIVADMILAMPKHASDNIFGIRTPTAFWNKVRREAGCPDLWVRDWRRTFATLALSNGTSLGIVGEVLNHRSAQTTKLYAKLTHDSRLTAVNNVADVFSELKEV